MLSEISWSQEEKHSMSSLIGSNILKFIEMIEKIMVTVEKGKHAGTAV